MRRSTVSIRHWSMTPIAMSLIALGMGMMLVGTLALPAVHAASMAMQTFA